MSESEILALEDKRFGAMTGKDWKTLDGLLHEQLAAKRLRPVAGELPGYRPPAAV